MRMETGLLKINSMIKVRYIGEDDPLSLRNGKVYDARVLKKGWFGIVDETKEEYAYPPELFEVISMTITMEQKKFLSKHIKDLDNILLSEDVNDLYDAIDDAIVDTFDANGNPSAVGIRLQQVFDEIYNRK